MQQLKQRPWQKWFNGLPRREQLAVFSAAMAVFCYVVYALVWQPMALTVDVLERQNKAAEQSVKNIKNLVAEYQQLQQSGSAQVRGSRQSLTRLIDSTARSNQLSMSRLQPSSSGDVQVRFENAEFNRILAWLNQLEMASGIVIKDLSVSPATAAGVVNISVRLHQGA